MPRASNRARRDETPESIPAGAAPSKRAGPKSASARRRDQRAAGQTDTAEAERAAQVTSAEWERVARDPLVQEVKEAVEGTLFDVRPAKRTKETGPTANGAGEANDND